jgi:transposase-like protein
MAFGDPTCPRCKAKGFIIKGYDNLKGRPEFKCRCCDNMWTSGNDGKPYYDTAIENMIKNKIELPKLPKMTSDGFNSDFIEKWG